MATVAPSPMVQSTEATPQAPASPTEALSDSNSSTYSIPQPIATQTTMGTPVTRNNATPPNNSIVSLSNTSNSARHVLPSTMAEMQAQLSLFQKHVQELAGQNNILRTQLGAITTQLNAHKSRSEAMEEQLKQLLAHKTRAESMETNFSGLVERVVALNSHVEKLSSGGAMAGKAPVGLTTRDVQTIVDTSISNSIDSTRIAMELTMKGIASGLQTLAARQSELEQKQNGMNFSNLAAMGAAFQQQQPVQPPSQSAPVQMVAPSQMNYPMNIVQPQQAVHNHLAQPVQPPVQMVNNDVPSSARRSTSRVRRPGHRTTNTSHQGQPQPVQQQMQQQLPQSQPQPQHQQTNIYQTPRSQQTQNGWGSTNGSTYTTQSAPTPGRSRKNSTLGRARPA
jgi:hypothetical protein